MIPASYLFKNLYRGRFESTPEQRLATVESRGRPVHGRGPLDAATAALLGFAFGSSAFTLGAANPGRQDPCR